MVRFSASEKAMPAPSLIVNGNTVSLGADGDTPLLDVLRNHLGLVGTKFGCGQEQCGSCMGLVDGQPEQSCGTAPAACCCGPPSRINPATRRCRRSPASRS